MLISLVLLLTAAEPARVDADGHSLSVIERTLDRQLGALEACLLPMPAQERGKPRVVRGDTRAKLTIVISAPGAVATVKLDEPGALDRQCVEKILIRLEFGFQPKSALARNTVVTATLLCTSEGCRWPWMAEPALDDWDRTLATSRSWLARPASTLFVFAADGGVATDQGEAGSWRLHARQLTVSRTTVDGGLSRVTFTVAPDGGLVGDTEPLVPGWAPLADHERLQGAAPCDERCPPRQTCLSLRAKCPRPPCPLEAHCAYE
jgi:hypothetical protein